MFNVTVPDHVPKELVDSFNVFTMDPRADIFTEIGALHETKPPIFYNTTPQMDRTFTRGAWQVTSMDLIREIMRTPADFSSVGISGFNELIQMGYELMIPIDTDPPLHARVRSIIREHLLPANIEKLSGGIRDLARDLVRRCVDQGDCEFVRDVASIYPTQIFLLLMGLPMEEADEFLAWEAALLQPDPNDLEKTRDAIRKIVARVRKGFDERRQEPGDDFLTLLVKADVSEELRLGLGFNLFVGGLDTVMNQLTWVFKYIGERPGLQRELRGKPDAIASALEEIMRLNSVLTTRRFVTRDLEFHGVTFKKGDSIELFMAAGNLDGEAFENPSEPDLARKPNRHLGFGWGPHMCVGMHLARLEMRILVEEWLDAVPEFFVKRPDELEFHLGIWGLNALPLGWEAHAADADALA